MLLLCTRGDAATPETLSGDTPLEVQEFERLALIARTSIKSGEFRVHRISQQHAPDLEVTEDIITYLSGSNVREDQIRNGITSIESLGKRYYSFPGVNSSSGHPMALIAADRAKIRSEDHYLYEPVKLMFYPTWYRAAENVNLQSYIGSSNRRDIKFERTLYDGVAALKVSFICNTNQCKFTYWGIPSQGSSIVKMVAECGKQVCSVQGRVAQFKNEIWFPVEVNCQVSDEGKVTLDERLTITASHLNDPIDPSVFEPIGMNVPVGTKVHLLEVAGHEFKWDGSDIVSMSQKELDARMLADAMPDSKRSKRVLYLTISAILGFVAMFLLWRVQRRRTGSAS